MTDDMLREYQYYIKKLIAQVDSDGDLSDAWVKVDELLEHTEAEEGGSYGGLYDMLRAHFEMLSEVCGKITLVSQSHEGRQCCFVSNTIEETLTEFPCIEVEGTQYVSIELIDTILDYAKRGYTIDAKTDRIEFEEPEKATVQDKASRPRAKSRKRKNRRH